jgi:hypothetical protein
MIPFMFRVSESADSKYVVKKTKCFDYHSYKSEWMCDEVLGKYCLVPDVDMTECQYVFDTEKEALECMKLLWSELKL